MPRLAGIILAALELEYVDLLLLAVPDDFDLDTRALHERHARGDGITIGRQEHLVEGDLGARLDVHERKTKGLALFGTELLAEGFEDGVHRDLGPIGSGSKSRARTAGVGTW